ncbi:MAG: hypothetical protein JJE25_01615, partial [Bacteroidia bacterium]|nr:hypothetical protein [Bacteroidia bacterium]
MKNVNHTNHSRIAKWSSIFLLCLMSFASYSQVSVTATAGTVGPTAYTTLGAALAAINDGTHQGDVTVAITANTTETSTAFLNGSTAGSANYTSVLIRPDADGLTVQGAPASSQCLVLLNGADNVTIDGDNPNTSGINRDLTFRNTLASTVLTGNAVIRLGSAVSPGLGADNNTIKNCIINGISSYTSGATTGNTGVLTFGIFAGLAANASATSVPVNVPAKTAGPGPYSNLLIQNNLVTNCSNGIFVAGSTAAACPGLNINSNTVGSATLSDYVFSGGICIQGSTSGVIDNNTIQNVICQAGHALTATGVTLTRTNPYGILVASTLNTGVTVSNNNVQNIQMLYTGGYSAHGITIGGGNNHIVYNNFISEVMQWQSGSTSVSFSAKGLMINAGTGHTIAFNSISCRGSMGGTSAGTNALLWVASTASTGMTIVNNIFDQEISGTFSTTNRVCVVLPNTSSALNLTLNNNAYFLPISGSNTAFGWNGSVLYLTFADLVAYTQTLSASGTNDNASFGFIATGPFVSISDLHINTSDANAVNLFGTGTAVSGITTDIDGQARNASPCIGADEFTISLCTTQFDVTGGGSNCPSPGVEVGLSGSQTGFNYQLRLSGTDIGSPVAGTGSAISFGNQSVAGTYSVLADNGSSCQLNMSGSVAVTLLDAPVITSVTADPPSVCAGGSSTLTANIAPVITPISNYIFTQSNTAYTPLVGATILGQSPTFDDDVNFPLVDLGFTFYYRGVPFTTIGLSDNCFARLGVTTTTSYAALTAQTNVLAPINADMLGNSATHQIRYQTSGAIGNRVFTCEWFNWGKYSSGLSEVNVQMKLYEATSAVQFIYQPATPATSFTCEVGLNGATLTDFQNRTTTTDWSATTAGGTNAATCSFSSTIYPADGLTFTWTPPAVNYAYTWSTSGPGSLSDAIVNPTTGTNITGTTLYNVAVSNGSCTSTASISVSTNVDNALAATVTATPPPANGDYTALAITYDPVSPPGGTNPGPAGDDVVSAPIPIGFTFNFYGTDYTNLVISTNGFISFDAAPGSGCCAGQAIPNTLAPNNVIATCWTDLNTGTSGNIDYFNLTSPNRFVVRFNGVGHFAGIADQVTSQIILYDDGTIELHNTSILNSGTMTQGVEKAGGTMATAVPGRNASGWSATNDAYRFFIPAAGPPCPEASWTLTATPTGGGAPYTYAWSGDHLVTNNTETVTANPTADVSPTTTYTVVVTDNCGASVTQTVSVTVQDVHIAVTPSSSTICDYAQDVTLTASGTVDTYEWSPSANLNTTTGPTAIANPPYPGRTYTVTGTATSSGCIVTAEAVVTVNHAPIVIASATPAAVCNPGTSVLNATETTAEAVPFSLNSTFAGGNGQNGNMFDVTALSSIIITGIDQNLNTGFSHTVNIYSHPGSFAGTEATPGAWTLLGSASGITSLGAGIGTPIPIALNLNISAGQTVALYVTCTNNPGSATVAYTNGTAQGSVYSSDANLQILEGIGKQWDAGFAAANFGIAPDSRIWNGTIHYSSDANTGPATASSWAWTLLSGTGSINDATLQSPTASGITSSATFQVIASSADGCSGPPSSVLVTIPDGAPVVSISTDQPTPNCPGNAVTLTADVSNAAFETYLWSTNETTKSITVNPSVATDYTVTVTDFCQNLSTTATVSVTVATIGNTTVTPSLICGQVGNFSTSVDAFSGGTIIWQFENPFGANNWTTIAGATDNPQALFVDFAGFHGTVTFGLRAQINGCTDVNTPSALYTQDDPIAATGVTPSVERCGPGTVQV